MLSHVLTNIFFRYARPNGEQIDEFEIEDDTHQTIGRCRCLESHTPTEEAIATSGHLAVETVSETPQKKNSKRCVFIV